MCKHRNERIIFIEADKVFYRSPLRYQTSTMSLHDLPPSPRGLGDVGGARGAESLGPCAEPRATEGERGSGPAQSRALLGLCAVSALGPVSLRGSVPSPGCPAGTSAKLNTAPCLAGELYSRVASKHSQGRLFCSETEKAEQENKL